MTDHWFIIVNPAAGGGAAGKLWPTIERLLQELNFSYTVQFSQHKGHAIELAENAVLKGHRQLLSVGGDGTNHEVVNGIMRQSKGPTTEILYALLPVGTGNDWARMYNLTHDPRKRLQQLLHPRIVYQDVGKVSYITEGGTNAERYFVNVAGMAYDAFVVRAIARRKRPLRSRIQYLLLVLGYLFDYRLLPASITIDGEEIVHDHFYTINIGVCRYSGGGMQFVPHAIADDGLLALTAARRVSKWEVLLQTPRFYNGKLLEHRQIDGWQAREISIIHPTGGSAPTLLEADGEFLGVTPAVFGILPKALQVAV